MAYISSHPEHLPRTGVMSQMAEMMHLTFKRGHYTGHFTRGFKGVTAKILGSWKTMFKTLEEAEIANNKCMWAPFHDEEERELASFLMKNVGQNKMDEFLKLSKVCNSSISFNSTWTFLKKVDRLCTGLAWTCKTIDVVSDVVGKDNVMAYVPEHAYADEKGENHIYDEMWTGDWWWDMQTQVPKGAVVAPVILSSDKTSLSIFSGDKKAWPVYLTIGNISKDTRCQVSVHATILIGYLPVLRLKCFQKKTCSLAGHWLFHHAMSLVLQPLIDAGCHGREMVCTDGYLCWVHPILAAYIADFPKQCLVACNKENHCPCCLVKSDKCGDLEECTWHSMMDTLKTLQCKQRNKQSRKFDAEGLHAVYKPFWKDLPFMDIFACITPNILHQLHKGVFHDHLLQWCIRLIGEKEIDILFMGLLSGAVDKDILLAMQDSLKMFHDYKHILIDLEVCQDFNIPKLHLLQHYVTSIRALGSADGYNTKYPERLHIDYAKDAYQASNKCDYIEQMALWLQCQEAIHYKSTYLTWRRARNLLQGGQGAPPPPNVSRSHTE
ncbi:hypothetical protein EDC04DRAFT_2871203 [Pisolithus marmoratus]|nr:hypothetical protein EDC04DRAFT_2871203 [Pisolithus marmoratus]